jgi:hypothetical protein
MLVNRGVQIIEPTDSTRPDLIGWLPTRLRSEVGCRCHFPASDPTQHLYINTSFLRRPSTPQTLTGALPLFRFPIL